MKEVGVEPLYIHLGEVILREVMPAEKRVLLASRLKGLGFELLDDVRQRQIERIKSLIIQEVQRLDGHKLALSTLLSKELNREYSQLSKLFSETEGMTIEHYAILQRIEKVKELLTYNELSLGEIADTPGYSSVAHLSAQFKKVTGLTPSAFKAHGGQLRKPLDGLSDDKV